MELWWPAGHGPPPAPVARLIDRLLRIRERGIPSQPRTDASGRTAPTSNPPPDDTDGIELRHEYELALRRIDQDINADLDKILRHERLDRGWHCPRCKLYVGAKSRYCSRCGQSRIESTDRHEGDRNG